MDLQESFEYNQSMILRIYNIRREDHIKGIPISNRETTNIGKLVCPRVKFSSDLMEWFAHAYNTEKMGFYNIK